MRKNSHITVNDLARQLDDVRTKMLDAKKLINEQMRAEKLQSEKLASETQGSETELFKREVKDARPLAIDEKK